MRPECAIRCGSGADGAAADPPPATPQLRLAAVTAPVSRCHNAPQPAARVLHWLLHNLEMAPCPSAVPKVGIDYHQNLAVTADRDKITRRRNKKVPFGQIPSPSIHPLGHPYSLKFEAVGSTVWESSPIALLELSLIQDRNANTLISDPRSRETPHLHDPPFTELPMTSFIQGRPVRARGASRGERYVCSRAREPACSCLFRLRPEWSCDAYMHEAPATTYRHTVRGDRA